MTAPTQVIIDWLSGLGWDDRQELGYPLLPGPYVPPDPDRLVVITGAGGPGYITEEATADGGIFQARLRGPVDDPLTAEAKATELDLLILRARFPAAVSGTTIVNAFRSGSGPTVLPFDPSDRRSEFTCNYVFITGV